MCRYVYTLHIYIYMYMFIDMYIEREKWGGGEMERERLKVCPPKAARKKTRPTRLSLPSSKYQVFPSAPQTLGLGV